jgi:hypothetical protein
VVLIIFRCWDRVLGVKVDPGSQVHAALHEAMDVELPVDACLHIGQHFEMNRLLGVMFNSSS